MLKRRFFGLTYAFGYENVHYLFRKEQSFYKEPQFDLIGIGPGLAWDIGCNFGLWSLYASANGYHVVAFDLSRYAAAWCAYNALLNAEDLTIVSRPLTCKAQRYVPPTNAHQENRLTGLNGPLVSNTWAEAAETHGIPVVIKMDIEGGELEFLRDNLFIAWLNKHQITTFIECHSSQAIDLARNYGMMVRGGRCSGHAYKAWGSGVFSKQPSPTSSLVSGLPVSLL